MSTVGQSESMDTFFEKYVHSKTTLKLFVKHYKNALTNKCGKESHADCESFNRTIPYVYDYVIEKQFQLVYTNAKF